MRVLDNQWYLALALQCWRPLLTIFWQLLLSVIILEIILNFVKKFGLVYSTTCGYLAFSTNLNCHFVKNYFDMLVSTCVAIRIMFKMMVEHASLLCSYSLLGIREHIKKRPPLATTEKVQQLVKVGLVFPYLVANSNIVFF